MYVVIVVLVACGIIAGSMASNRGHSFGVYFVVGLLFGIFGILFAAILKAPTSPVLSQLTPATAAGWHRDPTGRFDRRFYDGNVWTMHVTRDADQQQFEDPI